VVQAGCPTRVHNFSTDIRDSVAYGHLIQQIAPKDAGVHSKDGLNIAGSQHYIVFVDCVRQYKEQAFSQPPNHHIVVSIATSAKNSERIKKYSSVTTLVNVNYSRTS
jgi:hypothetical protein